jgi:hypothetical protein
MSSNYCRKILTIREILLKGDGILKDEQIKEVTIAMINKGLLGIGENIEEVAKDIAKFIEILETQTRN